MLSHSFDLFYDVSGRYSHSLFVVSNEENILEIVSDDLSRLEKLIVESSDFRFFVNSPVFSMKDRYLVIDDLVKKSSFCDMTKNFLRVLVYNGRLSILPMIVKSFRDVCMYYRNQIVASIRTFSSLSLHQKNELIECLEKKVGKSIILDIIEDSALIGGFIVEIGSHQIDASLRTKLLNLGFILKEVD
ncbi:ATP synthase F1 subunit delta [Candidatus Liberibacter brunswickensis]|uniref:ATP synthase F1 subunit delta n=1 Tax=Candidatus Liberibacter brunswickensis TaxID=1968796 RepID=UPI002FE157EF